MLYADLEIRIVARDSQDGTEGYRVELTLDQGQEFGPGFARKDGLTTFDATGAETKQAYGERLFEALFADPKIKSGWDRARGQNPRRRIRLRIDPELSELHPIQWELLRAPSDDSAQLSLQAATPFSRYLPQEWQPGTAVLERPIKVLVAVANPSDLADWKLQSVDAKTEYESLLTATADIKDEDGAPAIRFDLLPHPCTLDAIRDALKQGYHVLHFIGHGTSRLEQDENGVERLRTSLLLPNAAKSDKVEQVADTAIAEMIGHQLGDPAVQSDERLRLVFLESCETATRDANDAYRGLAPQLVKSGVAAVVAMQDLVEVKTARPFASTFYRQLLRHGQVDLACNEARDAVRTQKLRGDDVPVLFMRLRSGELLRVRGRVAQTDRATFWKRLSVNINTEQCVPFLGPRINSGIVPRPEAIARWLAAGNGYALADADKLARVAQFEAYKDPSAFRSMYMKRLKEGVYRSVGRAPTAAEVKQFDKQTLRAVTDAVGWGEASKKVEECRIYHALADLQLPLYVTTNVDDFMYEALAHHPALKPEDVRRIGPRWQKATEGAPPHSVLEPEPSSTTPYVLHLNGFDDTADPSQLDHVALSEDDMMSKYIRLARDQVEIIPSNIVTRLSDSSWLFLGYDIDDWEFRVVVQGLLQPIAQARATTKLHIGVQLEVGPGGTGIDEQAVQKYLQGYLEQRFRITVYWGSPAQFVAELNRRLLED